MSHFIYDQDHDAEFYDDIKELCWSLWTELGVRGVVRHHQDCMIPIEELIFLTCVICKKDSRLRDESLDWLSKYHRYVSVYKIRAMAKVIKNESPEIFKLYRFYAGCVNSVSSANWPFADEKVPHIRLSMKSVLSSLESPAMVLFRIRSLVSAGAKSDILWTFLATNEAYCASSLEKLMYSKRSILTALDQLVDANVLALEIEANRHRYRLRNAKLTQEFLGEMPKKAPKWGAICNYILALTKNTVFRKINTEYTKKQDDIVKKISVGEFREEELYYGR